MSPVQVLKITLWQADKNDAAINNLYLGFVKKKKKKKKKKKNAIYAV